MYVLMNMDFYLKILEMDGITWKPLEPIMTILLFAKTFLANSFVVLKRLQFVTILLKCVKSDNLMGWQPQA